jgi:YtkA-like protein
MRTGIVVGVLSIVFVLLSGCGNSDLKGHLTQIDRQQGGPYTVTALNSSGRVRVGKTTLVLEFQRTSDNRLADPGNVSVSLWMPMSGMPPMFGSASAEPLDEQPGRYRVITSDVSMAGTWFLVVKYAGGQRTQLTLQAR